MKCPYCKYDRSFDFDRNRINNEEDEDFIKLEGILKRGKYEKIEANIYACPKCKILFIEY